MEIHNAFEITGAQPKVGTEPALPEMALADRALVLDDFARATGDQLKPHIAYVPRFAGSLTVGEVVLESHLGALRVARNVPVGEHVHLTWRDDHGPGRPIGRYPNDQGFLVRSPGPQDKRLVQRQLDLAAWHKIDISGLAARLIAAHLHPGPGSATYRYAINGAFEDDRIFDELNEIHTNQPAYRPWINALTRHLVGREHRGPLLDWVKCPEGETDDPELPSNLAVTMHEVATSLDSDIVQQLINEAFNLGLSAARSGSARSFGPRVSASSSEDHHSAYWRRNGIHTKTDPKLLYLDDRKRPDLDCSAK